MSYLFWTIIISILVTFFVVLGVFIYLILKYKHRVRIREIIKGRKVIFDYKARDKTVDGVHYWRIAGEKQKERRLIPVPPTEAIEINSKGKKVIEAYRFPTNEVSYIKDTAQVEEPPEILYSDDLLPDDIINIEDEKEREKEIQLFRTEILAQWKKDNHIIEAFQPLTTVQRSTMVHQLVKAEQRKKNSLWDSIPQVVSIAAAVLLVVCLMIFWGDIAKPVLDGKEINRINMEIQRETVEILREVKQGIQVIEGQQGELEQRLDMMEEEQQKIEEAPN